MTGSSSLSSSEESIILSLSDDEDEDMGRKMNDGGGKVDGGKSIYSTDET